MAAKQEEYVGETIRRVIKDKYLTNGYVIQAMKENGIEMTDTKFSNKIYGKRDSFKPDEITVISEILGISL